jgi:hypothetical protein
MNPQYIYPQLFYQPQDRFVPTRQTHSSFIELIAGVNNNIKPDTNSEYYSHPNVSTLDIANALEFQHQRKLFEMEHQLQEEQDNDFLINISYLSLLNCPDPLPPQVHNTQFVPQYCQQPIVHTLPNTEATASPITSAKNAQEETLVPSSYKKTAVSKKKPPEKPSQKRYKSLRKWRQWIWIDDQKSELIEVRDIYKKKKRPYDEWCSILTTTKK